MSSVFLQCSGAGAADFLQGQLTCNVKKLKKNKPQLTACCNVQGRIIFITTLMMHDEECFLLLIPASMQSLVINHLEKYARFSQCQLNVSHDTFFSLDHKTAILHALPNIYPATSQKIIAQHLNLHLIAGAMSFKKGCYLGQEIIARLHFKGKLKYQMYLGSVANTITLAHNANIIDISGKVVGTVVDYCVDEDKILLLFVNSITNDQPKLDNGQAITLLTLPYLNSPDVGELSG